MCGVEEPDGLAGKDLADIDENGTYYAISQFPRPYAALHKAKIRTHMGYSIRDGKYTYVEWYDNNGKITDKEFYDMTGKSMEDRNLISAEMYQTDIQRLSNVLHKEYVDKIISEK